MSTSLIHLKCQRSRNLRIWAHPQPATLRQSLASAIHEGVQTKTPISRCLRLVKTNLARKGEKGRKGTQLREVSCKICPRKIRLKLSHYSDFEMLSQAPPLITSWILQRCASRASSKEVWPLFPIYSWWVEKSTIPERLGQVKTLFFWAEARTWTFNPVLLHQVLANPTSINIQ